MDRVAISIFGIDIMWYGIIIGIGVVIATYVAIREARRIGFKEDDLLDFLIIAFPVAIICARLYYIIFSWGDYAGDLKAIFDIRSGGLAIHGGIIGAVIVAIIFTKVKNINFWTLADLTAPSIALGQAIGRWGNYVNQEAYGGPTDLPWGIIIDGVKVHPTFLYESIWTLLIFLGLHLYRHYGKRFEGQIFLLYLMLYSVGRFFIEGLRTDSLMFGDFRVAQLLSLATIIVSLIIYRVRLKKGREFFIKMR